MGEEPRPLSEHVKDDIREHVNEARGEIGRNIRELGARTRQAVDWRAQFRERPVALILLAFIAGVFLGIGTR